MSSYRIDTPMQFGSGVINTPGLTLSSVVQTDASSNLTTGNVSLASQVTGTLPATNGGSGQTTYAVGDILYASTTSALSNGINYNVVFDGLF